MGSFSLNPLWASLGSAKALRLPSYFLYATSPRLGQSLSPSISSQGSCYSPNPSCSWCPMSSRYSCFSPRGSASYLITLTAPTNWATEPWVLASGVELCSCMQARLCYRQDCRQIAVPVLSSHHPTTVFLCKSIPFALEKWQQKHRALFCSSMPERFPFFPRTVYKANPPDFYSFSSGKAPALPLYPRFKFKWSAIWLPNILSHHLPNLTVLFKTA